MAREVELLAPSVNDGGNRPDNSEYPWEDKAAGVIRIPAEFTFPNLGVILQPSGARTIILKLIRSAINSRVAVR
jgi:hypothetical protein